MDPEDTERRPLLGTESEDAQSAPQFSKRTAWYQTANPQAINVLQTIMIFCVTVSAFMSMIPTAQLIENAVCNEYYRTEASPGGSRDCKVTEVQSQFSWLIGLQDSLETAAELVVAVPFGILADRCVYTCLF